MNHRVMVLLAGSSLLLSSCSPRPPRSAEDLVKRMSDRLAAAQSFSFSTKEKHQRRRRGKVVEVERARRFLVKRPAAMAFTSTGGELGGGTATYDGKSLTLVWPEHKAYARVRMPETIDAALDRLAERFNMPLPVGDLLYSRAYDALVSPDTKGHYVGRETVGAAECDEVAFTHARVDWQLWVAVRGEPTPCRITITTKGQSGPLTSDVLFEDWNLAAAPAGDAFQVRIPEGYERIMVAAYDTSTEASPPAATP